MQRPLHLGVFVSILEGACDEQVRQSLHSPARHGKTTLVLAAFIFYILNKPGFAHLYVTYNQTQALKKLEEFRSYLNYLGIEHRKVGNDSIQVDGGWRTGGTTITFTSTEGSVTGTDVNGLAVIDDPIKDAAEARSSLQRDKAWSFVQQSLMMRQQGHLSIVCIATRWHRDDVTGRLEGQGWPYVRLPLRCDDPDSDPNQRQLGELLWSGPGSPFTEEIVDELRHSVGEKVWEAMCQGNPFPDGERWFNEPARCPAIPAIARFKRAIGIDLAYSDSKKSDWSVAVGLIKDLDTGLVYLEWVERRQVRADVFVPILRRRYLEQPCIVHWFGSGTEKGTADLIKREIPKLRFVPTNQKKWERVLRSGVHRAWNDGILLVLGHEDRDTSATVQNVVDFTGANDPHDDDVDALTSAFEGLNSRSEVTLGLGSGTRAQDFRTNLRQRRGQW